MSYNDYDRAEAPTRDVPFAACGSASCNRPTEAGAHDGCAACDQACTQHPDIMERLTEIAGWQKKLNSRPARLRHLWK